MFATPAAAQTSGAYKVTNLISDGSVTANVTDASFINPWAISSSSTWWISTANTGLNYVVASTPTPGTINFKVVVPPGSATTGAASGFPAGSVTTAGASGMILPNGTKASFIFSTLDGTIAGWNSKLGTAGAICQIVVDHSASGASYPGLAILNTSATTSYILAANFAGNAIEVYDSTFQPAKLAGSFTDPLLPAGYAPFSVHVLNNKVYVAYALRTSTAPYRTVDAVGNGVVSIFDTAGNYLSRVATGGVLDSPWGVAIAPANFGIFGGSILVGNFGNGQINAFDPASLQFRGQLTDGTGKPLSYASLWELLPGGTTVGNTTSVSGGDVNTVYFTAGLASEAHGLFGAISNDSTTAGTPSFGLSTGAPSLTMTNGTAITTQIAIAPTYGFNGNVSLKCSGLPADSTCTFSPAQVAATGSAPAFTSLTIQTNTSTSMLDRKLGAGGVTTAFLLPFASMLVFFRRRSLGINKAFQWMVVCGVFTALAGLVVGCSSTSVTTPAGTSQVTVTATSGSISQTTGIALTVK